MHTKLKLIHKTLLLVLFVVLGPVASRAQRTNDDITVSLLTCSPGPLVYELYGHTALRVVDHTLGTDMVFNYGVFDFKQDHFIWRFMLGQTDYMVQPIPYFIFQEEYVERGSSIVGQTLNLTAAEANDLYNKLLQNIRPENRTYRYNFLKCNCTTMVRDMVESAIHGTVKYKEQDKKTYRECLHEFTTDSPWCELGDDILLGAATDTILTDRSSQFLPSRLQSYFQEATIYDSVCNSRPLVLGEPQTLLPEGKKPVVETFPLSPTVCALIFLGLMLLIFALEYWTRYIFWGIELLLMPGVGVAGLLVTFMTLFSEHPAVGSNWQVWVLNPLPLFCMPWVVWCAIKRKRCWYHPVYAVILTLFLIASPWIPQQYCVITLPLALALLTRPVSYLINFSRLKPKKKKSRK